ncbi:MAG: hypothetical protein WCZ48_04520 [Bacillota bacterium]|nr:hypothetical protein [Bacillota bacterium]HAN86246.1 hypothetical protein [Bacillota bacterium]
MQVIAEQSGRRRKCSVHARSCLAAARAGCESSTLYGEGVEPRSGGALTIRRHHEDVRALAGGGGIGANFAPDSSGVFYQSSGLGFGKAIATLGFVPLLSPNAALVRMLEALGE